MHVSMTINQKPQEGDVEPRMLLVDFLRDDLGLTGTKIGCDTGQCGSCTIMLNGISVKSCTTVSYTHLRAHETVLDLVCRLLLEKKKQQYI